jgi:hypothetical protein
MGDGGRGGWVGRDRDVKQVIDSPQWQSCGFERHLETGKLRYIFSLVSLAVKQGGVTQSLTVSWLCSTIFVATITPATTSSK